MTGIVGKFLNYWEATLTEDPPHFDDPPDFDRWTITNGLINLRVNDQGTLGWSTGYATTYLKDKGLAFLRDAHRSRKPWFLHLAVTAPHPGAGETPPQPDTRYENAPIPPFIPSPSYFEPDQSDKPFWTRRVRRTPEQVQDVRVGQMRSLMSVDDLVNDVFRLLRHLGEADNTLAFFISDNGYLWGEHGDIGKASPYEGSIRVPLLMRWRAGSAMDKVDDRLAANVDLLPTVLAATGVSAPSDVTLDGRSLLDPTWQRDRLLLEYWNELNSPDPYSPSQTFASIFTPTYHYTEWFGDDAVTPKPWPDAEGGGPTREYYDLLQDPYELTNLLHDGDPTNDPSIDSLSSQLARDRRCAGHGPQNAEPPPCP
jgi:arylsulfatase A-like enzyme